MKRRIIRSIFIGLLLLFVGGWVVSHWRWDELSVAKYRKYSLESYAGCIELVVTSRYSVTPSADYTSGGGGLVRMGGLEPYSPVLQWKWQSGISRPRPSNGFQGFRMDSISY